MKNRNDGSVEVVAEGEEDPLKDLIAWANRGPTASRTALLWADSLIGEAFTGLAPEVRWVLPAELRKVARRSPGT